MNGAEKEKKNNSQRGAVILEAAIIIPLFMLVILFVYGTFFVINAQNQITHAMIQTCKSMSLDPYLTEHVDSVMEAETFWGSLGSMVMDVVRSGNSKYYSSMSDWYDEGSGSGPDSVVKDRFIGYFGEGDEDEAGDRLEKLGVPGGFDSFSLTSSVDGDDLTINNKYTVQFWFDAFDLGKIEMEQNYKVRLLK